jgi:hypothetical protein
MRAIFHVPALGSTVALVLALAALLAATYQPAAGQPRNALKPYIATSKLYVLYKPSDWRVSENAGPASFRVLVQAPDGASTVDFFWAKNDVGAPNALAFLVAFKRSLSQAHGQVTLSDVFVSRDAARATATIG